MYHNNSDRKFLIPYIHYHIQAFVLLNNLSHLDMSRLISTKTYASGLMLHTMSEVEDSASYKSISWYI